MVQNNFAVFILTHGRPDRVMTYDSLRRQGYTGPVYLVVDNEDRAVGQYRARFGNQVIVFDKALAAEETDSGDNIQNRHSVLYARNAICGIAKQLGLEYFLELDDDYDRFLYKFDAQYSWREMVVIDLDRLFGTVLEFYKSIPALSVAFAQNGDFIGGAKAGAAEKIWLKRKAMNSFFCAVDRPFSFMGRLNDDVNTYVTLGHKGGLFLSIMQLSLIQGRTQQSAGGMTEAYLDMGTYVKSFYTILYAPSCVTIGEIGYKHRRIHHMIHWNNAVPCIVRESLRKSA